MIGTFTDVSVKMVDEISEDNFKPGFSHVITLDIYDASLGISSVEVAEWTPSYVDGNLDLIHWLTKRIEQLIERIKKSNHEKTDKL